MNENKFSELSDNANPDLDSFISYEIRKDIENGKINFPISIIPDFNQLIDYIKKDTESSDKIKRGNAESIINEVNKHPELYGDISDPGVIEKNSEIVSGMMRYIFPDFVQSRQAVAIAAPFIDKVLYASEKFDELFIKNDFTQSENLNIDPVTYYFGKLIGGFGLILNLFYGMNFRFDFPIVCRVPDPQTGLDTYYKMNMANEFSRAELKGELKELTQEEKDEIKSRIYDLNFLLNKIDTSNFIVKGFLVINMVNISDTEILSSIKKDLIEKDTITSYIGFLKLQHKLKSLLKCPGLFLGLSDLPSCDEEILPIGKNIGNGFFFNCKCINKPDAIKNSIYDIAIKENRIVIISDLEKYTGKTSVEHELLNQGIKNILIAPLNYNGQMTGLIEIAATSPDKINKFNALKLFEVLPLFSMAVSRSKTEINNRIQAVIQEQCTAIHPSLEWRFREAAMKVLQNESDGKHIEMEEIVFQNVYPLYGLSDIRNSSVHRNNSISEDLIKNLEMARRVIMEAYDYKKLEALKELNHKIEKRISSLKFSINSGDEVEISNFLKEKVEPVLSHIKGYSYGLKKLVEQYNSALDKELGIVYDKRKKYETSAAMISNMIASYLDEEQVKIQKVFPHYFERYKTDGVDHNIYVGNSLVKKGNFDLLYLRNLRLWQLIVTCNIALKSNQILDKLPYKLETAHLILIHSSPVSIKFRFDEKKFDVDGEYNVRYEIIKKRIDKAEIKGMEERLTQPDKIAIIYNQSHEAAEYYEYIEYLQAKKYLNKEIEELDLEDLQGVRGLKALRVTVNYSRDSNIDQAESDMILKNFTMENSGQKSF